MKFTAPSALLAGAALLSAMSAVSGQVTNLAQFSTKSLTVKSGGLITVTLGFVVEDFTGTLPIRTGLTTNPTFDLSTVASLTKDSKNDTKNSTKPDKSDKFAGETDVTIRSAKISPNVWRPKLSPNITTLPAAAGGGELAIFTIPENALEESKEYKITYKIRIGRGFESGDLITLPVGFDGPGLAFLDNIEVLVR